MQDDRFDNAEFLTQENASTPNAPISQVAACDTQTQTDSLTLEKLRGQVSAPLGGPFSPILIWMRETAPWKRFVLDKKESLIGRSSEADIPLNDMKVSRRHARVLWENFGAEGEMPRCRIEDCESHNGVYLNCGKVEGENLADGDRLLMGASLLAYFLKDNIELEYDNWLLGRASTDSLTDLPNRVTFEEEAARLFQMAHRYSRPFCLAVIDIDLFKSINDTHGHAAGDMVLRRVAQLMVQSLRQSDVAGRIGGDEFAVILPETNASDAVIALERLRAKMEQTEFVQGGNSMRATISIGVASIGPEHTAWRFLLNEADAKLRDAKNQGRNRIQK